MKNTIFIALSFSLIFAFKLGDSPALEVDKDVVLAITFDEGKGDVAKDLSPHGNDGTLQQKAKREKGKFGQAIRLDGTNQVEVENDDSLSLHKSDFTIGVWLYFEEDPPKGNRGSAGFTLLGHDEGGGSTNKWIWWYSGNGIDFHINTAGGAGVAWVDSEPWDPKLKQWYQMVLTKEGRKYTYYLDGKPFGRVDDNVPIPEEINHALNIGWSEGPFFFNGMLDEVLIVKRALSEDEVETHFDGGLKGFLAVQPHGKISTTWGNLKASASN